MENLRFFVVYFLSQYKFFHQTKSTLMDSHDNKSFSDNYNGQWASKLIFYFPLTLPAKIFHFSCRSSGKKIIETKLGYIRNHHATINHVPIFPFPDKNILHSLFQAPHPRIKVARRSLSRALALPRNYRVMRAPAQRRYRHGFRLLSALVYSRRIKKFYNWTFRNIQ